MHSIHDPLPLHNHRYLYPLPPPPLHLQVDMLRLRPFNLRKQMHENVFLPPLNLLHQPLWRHLSAEPQFVPTREDCAIESYIFEVRCFRCHLQVYMVGEPVVLFFKDYVEVEPWKLLKQIWPRATGDWSEVEFVGSGAPLGGQSADDLAVEVIGLHDALQPWYSVHTPEAAIRLSFEVVALSHCDLLRHFINPLSKEEHHPFGPCMFYKRMVVHINRQLFHLARVTLS